MKVLKIIGYCTEHTNALFRNNPTMSVRRLLLEIHFYGGILCFWYLLILGFSSLHYNHHFDFVNQPQDPSTWSHPMKLAADIADDRQLTEAIRDSLGLLGWPLPWETGRDSTGTFHVVVEHPGKRYVIDYSMAAARATVVETPKGFWRVFNSLHGFGVMPKAPITYAWSWYTKITIAVVVFAVFSGTYLWFIGSQNKKSGILTLLLCFSSAVALMLQMYFNG
jgi:hypothetical protein